PRLFLYSNDAPPPETYTLSLHDALPIYGANLQVTFDELARTMGSLCYRLEFTTTTGHSPAALGNRIAAAVIRHGRRDGSLERLQDRKSTRLNSSHDQISYAVFCLKKKNL